MWLNPGTPEPQITKSGWNPGDMLWYLDGEMWVTDDVSQRGRVSSSAPRI